MHIASLFFMTRAPQTILVRNVFEKCAHHTDMVAERVISIQSAESS